MGLTWEPGDPVAWSKNVEEVRWDVQRCTDGTWDVLRGGEVFDVGYTSMESAQAHAEQFAERERKRNEHVRVIGLIDLQTALSEIETAMRMVGTEICSIEATDANPLHHWGFIRLKEAQAKMHNVGAMIRKAIAATAIACVLTTGAAQAEHQRDDTGPWAQALAVGAMHGNRWIPEVPFTYYEDGSREPIFVTMGKVDCSISEEC
jgi:hypothetical protein